MIMEKVYKIWYLVCLMVIAIGIFGGALYALNAKAYVVGVCTIGCGCFLVPTIVELWKSLTE